MKQKFGFNIFVRKYFCRISFSVSKSLICFRISLCETVQKENLLQRFIFCFILNSSFKVFAGDYFQIWSYICKRFAKSFRYVIIIGNDFFSHYLFSIFFLYFLFFSIKVIFERVVTLSVKKSLTVLQNVLLSVTSVVLVAPNNVCFIFLIRVTQQLRCWHGHGCWLYTFLFHFWFFTVSLFTLGICF